MFHVQILSFTVACPGLHHLLSTVAYCDTSAFAFATAPTVLMSLSAHVVLKSRRNLEYDQAWLMPCFSETQNTAFFLCPPEHSKLVNFACKQSNISHQYRRKTWSVGLLLSNFLSCFSLISTPFPLQIVRDFVHNFGL